MCVQSSSQWQRVKYGQKHWPNNSNQTCTHIHKHIQLYTCITEGTQPHKCITVRDRVFCRLWFYFWQLWCECFGYSRSRSLSLSVSLSLPDNSCCALFWCCCAEWPHDACHDDMRVTTCISVCVHTLAKIKAKFTYWQKWKLRPRSLHNIYKLRMLVQKELGRSIIHFIWNTT